MKNKFEMLPKRGVYYIYIYKIILHILVIAPRKKFMFIILTDTNARYTNIIVINHASGCSYVKIYEKYGINHMPEKILPKIGSGNPNRSDLYRHRIMGRVPITRHQLHTFI